VFLFHFVTLRPSGGSWLLLGVLRCRFPLNPRMGSHPLRTILGHPQILYPKTVNIINFQSPLNTHFMSAIIDFEAKTTTVEKFKMYCAAVKKAELYSKGSGELNRFDHVAKDLHETGFDEMYENTPDWKKRAYFGFYEAAINKLADEKYLEEFCF
jgi:hypothetical protein